MPRHHESAGTESAGERIRRIGCTLWAPGDWIAHMAAAVGVDRRTVQRWVAGESEPDAAIFDALRGAAALRCQEIAAAVR